jgi:hypothetical protein
MRAIIVAAFASALLVPASAAPAGEGPIVLALNPQPEPPGRAKIKRIYTGGPDSRRNKTIKQPTNQVIPATKY